MNETSHSTDPEFAAMRTVFDALDPLEPDAQQRVVMYVNDRLGLSTSEANRAPQLEGDGHGHGGELPDPEEAPIEFPTLAELHDAAQPENDRNRALVAGYWLQVCEGAESFVGLSVNKELKDLGHGLRNVTHALSALKQRQPALVLQLKKGGKSQQARKTYKLTTAGIDAVKEMIGG